MSLKILRKQKGFSQKCLAAMVGVSQRSISSYESNQRKPSPEIAARIADVFGLSVEEMWEMFFKAS